MYVFYLKLTHKACFCCVNCSVRQFIVWVISTMLRDFMQMKGSSTFSVLIDQEFISCTFTPQLSKVLYHHSYCTNCELLYCLLIRVKNCIMSKLLEVNCNQTKSTPKNLFKMLYFDSREQNLA